MRILAKSNSPYSLLQPYAVGFVSQASKINNSESINIIAIPFLNQINSTLLKAQNALEMSFSSRPLMPLAITVGSRFNFFPNPGYFPVFHPPIKAQLEEEDSQYALDDYKKHITETLHSLEESIPTSMLLNCGLGVAALAVNQWNAPLARFLLHFHQLSRDGFQMARQFQKRDYIGLSGSGMNFVKDVVYFSLFFTPSSTITCSLIGVEILQSIVWPMVFHHQDLPVVGVLLITGFPKFIPFFSRMPSLSGFWNQAIQEVHTAPVANIIPQAAMWGVKTPVQWIQWNAFRFAGTMIALTWAAFALKCSKVKEEWESDNKPLEQRRTRHLNLLVEQKLRAENFNKRKIDSLHLAAAFTTTAYVTYQITRVCWFVK
jgi:hypothetical protein